MERFLHLLGRIPAGPVVAVVAIGGIWLMSGTPSAAVRVPHLEETDVNKAIARAAEDGFFTKVVFRTGGGVAGTVIRQRPRAEVIRNKRSTIVLEVTKGAAQIQVPDVRLTPVDDARRRLSDAHLRPGAVRYQKGGQVRSNSVIRTVPPHGTLVDVDSTVDIVAAV